MDILEQSKYCNFKYTPPDYQPEYPVDPNIISGGAGNLALPGISGSYSGFIPSANGSNVNVYNIDDQVFHYPDEDEGYYSPTYQQTRDQQLNIPYTYKPGDTNTNIVDVPVSKTKTPIKKTPEDLLKTNDETVNTILEFIKKPAVIGAGALIAIILIYKIIKS